MARKALLSEERLDIGGVCRAALPGTTENARCEGSKRGREHRPALKTHGTKVPRSALANQAEPKYVGRLMVTIALAALSVLAPFQETPRVSWKGESSEGARIAVPAESAKATVVLFVAVDCPIANRYAPELSRLQKEYEPKGIAFLRVYVDTFFEAKDLKEHGEEFSLTMPAFLDAKHELVKLLGATVTPEAAVVGPDGTLLYRGRIDDLYLEHGRVRLEEPRRDLRIALDEILRGEPVSVPRTPAIGCGIPDGQAP